jgi:protein-disulfide isomerase
MTGKPYLSRLTPPVSERDHLRGSPDAPVIVVEYGDYQCPHCGRAHPTVKQLLRVMGDQVSFVYRHFPLTVVHPHAEQAAEAAEAAGAQDNFWGMHDLLFEHQQALTLQHLAEYGVRLGLDVRRFTQELVERKYADRVREDFLGGARSGVNGTPTFFINGVRHDGGYDLETLMGAIEEVHEARTARR